MALLLRKNVFYESEIRKHCLEPLLKAYEPHRMPPSYIGDVVVMVHAVLRQFEQHGQSGDLVSRRRKKARRRKKKAAAQPAGG